MKLLILILLLNRVTTEVSSGSVVVNDCLYQFANLYAPFGGVGESGMGGYHGKFSFTCFSHMKPILRRDDHALLDVPLRFVFRLLFLFTFTSSTVT